MVKIARVRAPARVGPAAGRGQRACAASTRSCDAPPGPMVCDGHLVSLRRRRPSPDGVAPVRCLGRCYEAPATSATRAAADPAPRPRRRRRWCCATSSTGARRSTASRTTRCPTATTILDAVEASGLRGRGGAAFPTGESGRSRAQTAAADRVVVANGDEGDPGAYIDRLLLEEDPHAVLAGMLACARAIGARRGVVFIRARVSRGAGAHGRGDRRGERARACSATSTCASSAAHGSYVAGEETALLRAIEGLRAEPSPKPPYPAERGLDGLPTVVQNIETLCDGAVGRARRRRGDTKAVCRRRRGRAPGRRRGAPRHAARASVLARGGGGPAPGAAWKMALVGGPMGRVVPARRFDTPLSYEALPGMGHAGIVVFDETVSAARAGASISSRSPRPSRAAACTPCRVGTAQLAALPRSRGARAPARHDGARQPVRLRPGRAAALPRSPRAFRRRAVRMITLDGQASRPRARCSTPAAPPARRGARLLRRRIASRPAATAARCLVEADGRCVAACTHPRARTAWSCKRQRAAARVPARSRRAHRLRERRRAAASDATLAALGVTGKRYATRARRRRHDATPSAICSSISTPASCAACACAPAATCKGSSSTRVEAAAPTRA